MRNVSKQFYTTMEERRDFYPSVEITFSDGQKKMLGKDEMYVSGNTIVESAETSSFPLGQFAARRITLSIINDDDRWSVYNFAWAKIVLKTKFELLDGTTETINIGTYTVATPEAYGTTITITAIDDSYRCDKEYDTALTYPITVSEALLDSCATCGITLLSSHFNNSDYVIPSKPTNLTHRQFIGYCAMLAGGNAAMDEDNRLIIKTYDFSDFTKSSDEWGGVFDVLSDERYMTGDDISGGVFSPWDVGEVEDPVFSDLKNVNVLNNFGSGITVDVDYVVITGVQMSSGSEVYLYGQEGYVLSLDSPLAKGKEAEAVERIGQRIVGLKFRPFSGQHLAYPIAEFLDLAYVTDRNGRAYQTVLTDVDFTYFGYTALKCVADSPIRNSSTYYGNEVKAIIKAREESEELINQYDKAMSALNGLMANSLGLFTTTKYTESGGRIEYQHDKPTLEESEKIWEKSEAGFRVSTDGGETWNAGMDASGNAVLNALSIIGITFDWARGGTLTLGGVGNGDGRLVILNTWGAQVGYIDNTGAHFSQGEFYGAIYATEGRFYGELVSATGTFSGTLNAAKGVFSGSLSAATGTFAGQLSAASGTFSGTVSAGTVTGSNISGSNIDGTTITGGSIYGSSITSNLPNYTNRIVMNNSVLSLYIDSDFGDLSGQIYPFISSDVNVDGADITVGRASALGIQANNEMRLILDSHVIARIFKHWKSNITGDPVGNDWFFQVSEKFIAKKRSDFEKNVHIVGDLNVSGTKNRLTDTENYGKRLFYCYETTYPMFGDIGSGKTDENGVCYISIDNIFSESVRTDIHYHVFLQKEGQGDIWVEEKEASYFVVKGAPNLSFSWEVKAVQKDYTSEYLNDYDIRENEEMEDVSSAKIVLDEEIDEYRNIDIESMFYNDIVQYDAEMEGMFNENSTSVSGD